MLGDVTACLAHQDEIFICDKIHDQMVYSCSRAGED